MSKVNVRKIKTKKLGVLIRNARQTTCKTLEECAGAIGVTPDALEAFELGEMAPSLPELEMLSFYLKVPLEHFWGDGAHLIEPKEEGQPLNPKQLMGLRQKIIGVLLRKARLDKNLSLEEMEAASGIDASQLQAYELGQAAIPLPDLEMIAAEFGWQIKAFNDQRGPVGTWLAQQRFFKDFMDLSPDLQAFVCKPVNLPYLEVAQRLSEMSVDKLRNVAEVLLEITL